METLTQFSEANEKAASAITRTGRGTWECRGRPVADGLALADPWFQGRSQKARPCTNTGQPSKGASYEAAHAEERKRARSEMGK